MKLTKKRIKEIIKEELVNEIGFEPDPDVGKNDSSYYTAPKRDTSKGFKTFYASYSSNEAKNIVDGKLKDYVKQLRKIEGKLVADWMRAAKSGVIDFFDLVRGFNTGDAKRAYPYEIEFLGGLLEKDKIQDRFRSYFKGKKGKPGRKW